MIFHNSKSCECKSSLLERSASWPNYKSLDHLTSGALQEITRVEGIDFATSVLFDRFQKSPRHAKFIQRINNLRKGFSMRNELNAKVVIVPGALYIERPEVGGDGRIVREVAKNFGCSTDLIPLISVGSISENARRISRWLTRQSDERIILVSLSKGSAEVKVALSLADASISFRNVAAWINVGGPLNGTHMANWILESPVRKWLTRIQYKMQRRDFRFITELRHGPDSLLDEIVRLPNSLRLVNLVGFPMRRDFSTRFSRFCQRTLATWGPNDGTISLSDVAQWPGEIYPVWGTDHYFRPPLLAKNLVAAILKYLSEEIAFKPKADWSIGENAAS